MKCGVTFGQMDKTRTQPSYLCNFLLLVSGTRTLNRGMMRLVFYHRATTAYQLSPTQIYLILLIGATTFSKMIFSIMTLTIMTLTITTLTIMTLTIMTLIIMTLTIMTLTIMTLIIMTLTIMTFSITTNKS